MRLPELTCPYELLRVEQAVVAERLAWLAVSGALSLALRHPQLTGPRRKLIREFNDQLTQGLIDWGVLTEGEMVKAFRVEAEQSPHGGS